MRFSGKTGGGTGIVAAVARRIASEGGHGDVDLTTTWKFAENQHVFTFREFIIPVASTFFYNFDDMRSTGKFLGVTGAGRIENSPAGAFIQGLDDGLPARTGAGLSNGCGKEMAECIARMRAVSDGRARKFGQSTDSLIASNALR